MNAFSEWSLQRQKRFWLGLARDLIQSWNLAAADLSWLGYGNNAVFKVNAVEGEFVLRLHPPGRLNAAALRSELAWLRQIDANTTLTTPAPIATANHVNEEFFAHAASNHLPPPRQVYGCLFRFIPGQPKSAAQLTASDMERIGSFLARLHSEAQFPPPAGFSRPRLDCSGLFGSNSPYHVANGAASITPAQEAILSQVAQRAQAAMITLGENADAFGMIHGDLLAKNILCHNSQLAALDFEYCGWGYFLYDLAPLLWQLKGERPTDYRQLESALWSGYISLRPQADELRRLLEDFIAARQWASVRWLLAHRHHPTIRQQAPALIAARAKELQSYLEDGVLRRQTPTL